MDCNSTSQCKQQFYSLAAFYQPEIVSASDYYHKGMIMDGRSFSSEQYRFGFNGKEKDNEVSETGNQYDYGFRIYNPRLGKFLSVDPLFRGYPWNSTYAFAENDVIRSIDLDGLEKVALSGTGNGSNYTSSDKNSFHARALDMKKYGYAPITVSKGSDVYSAFKHETQKAGYVSNIIHFSHGGYPGMFLDQDEGLYTTGVSYGGLGERTVNDIKNGVAAGEINFSRNTTWIMASCYASYAGGESSDFAYDVTTKLGITTISATGYVGPEIVDGSETGKLTTTGTFLKLSKVYDITYDVDGREETKTFNSKGEADAYNVGFNYDNRYKFSISERVSKEDLGNTLDPGNVKQ